MSESITKQPDSDDMRSAIFRMEDRMLQEQQVDIPIINRFAEGLYSREMIVEPGVLWTGMVHKQQHIGILLEGRMIVPDGKGGSEEIAAPRVEISEPGIKRVGYVLERVRWITVHATELTDVEEIEETLVTNDPREAKQIADETLSLLLAVKEHKMDENEN